MAPISAGWHQLPGTRAWTVHWGHCRKSLEVCSVSCDSNGIWQMGSQAGVDPCRLQYIRLWNLLMLFFMGFPGGSDGKESAYNVGDLGLIPGSGRSPRGVHGNPLQYSCLENPYGQRSLVGYSPWGRKELDNDWETKHTHTHNGWEPVSAMFCSFEFGNYMHESFSLT